ncbi:hypothetical protein PDJAM_G00099170 [Pangasius djambal]|uniref:Uncharacterized protein n=1 Tax=Pangasius djambal TaxID=1691987 RepID=A0ACC5Z7N5_9TELE|nr:hypothetical protein [Pangasius djambal]
MNHSNDSLYRIESDEVSLNWASLLDSLRRAVRYFFILRMGSSGRDCHIATPSTRRPIKLDETSSGFQLRQAAGARERASVGTSAGLHAALRDGKKVNSRNVDVSDRCG